MKVLVIAHNANGSSGGWGRMTSEILAQFEAAGVQHAAFLEHAEGASGQVLPLLPSSGLINFVRNIVRVRRAASTFDVIHAMDVWPYAAYGYFACLFRETKLFVNGVGTYSVAPLYSAKRFLLRRVLDRAAKIFAISSFTLRAMEQVYPLGGRGMVVHLGVTKLPMPSGDQVRAVIARYGLATGPIILTVGAIKDRKGQMDTLLAIHSLLSKHPTLTYVMVGDARGAYAEELRQYIAAHALEKNVRILDSVRTNEELACIYSVADIFALNSNNDDRAHHFEGFGLVFLEAYQFGVPGIGSRNCGIESAIRDGVTGYLSNQRDPEDIARKIALALEKPKASYAASIQQFLGEFSWRKTAESYVSCYKDCK